MGRLEELRINAYLSEVARGYNNNAFIAQNLFPTIYSEKEKIDIFEFNKEAFNLYDTERAIRANSNVIAPEGFKKHTTTLSEHDLSYPIDYREEQEAEKEWGSGIGTNNLFCIHLISAYHFSLISNPANELAKAKFPQQVYYYPIFLFHLFFCYI